MNRKVKLVLLILVTCLCNVCVACAQNKELFPETSFYEKSHSDTRAYLLDAYGDSDDDLTYLGYNVIEKKIRFNDDSLRKLLKAHSFCEKKDELVSFSSFMPDAVVVFAGQGREVSVFFDFSHNLLQFYFNKGTVVYDFSENRSEYLDAIIQIFPSDIFLKQYAVK